MQPDPDQEDRRSILGRWLTWCQRVFHLPPAVTQGMIFALVLGLSLAGYLTVLKTRGPAAQIETKTGWDDAIPFVPWWVWLYLLPYAVGPVAALTLSRDSFEWFVGRVLILLTLSLAVFIVVPTRTVRPPVDHLDSGVTASIYRQMIATDEPPANAAPSLHVSFTCLMALTLVRDHRRWWFLALVATILVALSTLFTQQHHLIDVITGAALAGLVAAMGWKGESGRE